MYSSLVSNDHGVIHVRQHHHLANISQTFLDACADGELIKLSRGGYARRKDFESRSPWDRHRLRIAATAADYNSATVVGNSAGIWHRLWIHDPSPQLVEVHRFSARLRTQSTIRAEEYLRNLHIPVADHEKTVVDGISVTTVERTILDICRIHGIGPAFVSLCHALRRGLTTKKKVLEAFEACKWNDHIAGFGPLIRHATGLHRFPTSAYLHAVIAAEDQLTVTGVGDGVLTIKEFRLPIALDSAECALFHVFLQSHPDWHEGETLSAKPTDAHPTNDVLEWKSSYRGRASDGQASSPKDTRSRYRIAMEMGNAYALLGPEACHEAASRNPVECHDEHGVPVDVTDNAAPGTTADRLEDDHLKQAKVVEPVKPGSTYNRRADSPCVRLRAEDVYNRHAHTLLCRLAGIEEKPQRIHLTSAEFGQTLSQRIGNY